MTNKTENNTEKKEVEEINLDELDMNELDFPQGGCNCSTCPMSCHDDLEDEDVKK